MAKTIKINLVEGWKNYDNPSGPLTYLHSNANALQISWNEYISGPEPHSDPKELEKMSIEFGKKFGLGDSIKSTSGTCEFGYMGTAIFKSENYPRVQVWQLSNGRDFITATHICAEVPEQKEINDVQDMVQKLILKERKSKWKFW